MKTLKIIHLFLFVLFFQNSIAHDNELESIKNRDEINVVFGKTYVIAHSSVISRSANQAEMKARIQSVTDLATQLKISAYKIERNPDSSALRDSVGGHFEDVNTIKSDMNKLEDGTYQATIFSQISVESETDMSKAVVFSKVFTLNEYSAREVSNWVINILNKSDDESLLKSTKGLLKYRRVYSSKKGFVLPDDPKDFKTDGKSVNVSAAFWPSN